MRLAAIASALAATFFSSAILAAGSKSPSTCLLFHATEGEAQQLRLGSAEIAKRLKLSFADKSGEFPWPELVIYLQVKTRHGEAIAQQRRNSQGWVCFYGDLNNETMAQLFNGFSVLFSANRIKYHEGRP